MRESVCGTWDGWKSVTNFLLFTSEEQKIAEWIWSMERLQSLPSIVTPKDSLKGNDRMTTGIELLSEPLRERMVDTFALAEKCE